MVMFKGHEIQEDENGLVEIILHIDTSNKGLEEFAMELGHKHAENLDITREAYRYVKSKLPKVKVKQIKVMMAGVLVASMLGTVLMVPNPGTNQVYAAETTISSGSLSVDTITVGNFTAVVLNGQTQSTFATIDPFNVSDSTGSGNGWNVIMTATQFTTGGTTPLTLPLGSLTVAAPTITKVDAGSSDVTTITPSSGVIDSTSGLKLLSAGLNGGMGSYSISFPTDSLKLNLLPKDVKAGTYTSTISVTINSGP